VPEIIDSINEPTFTPEELAKAKKLHPATIRKLFVAEVGVLRFGHPATSKRRQYWTLRIPKSVVERVFGNMTVQA
jgi:hypothetical protein